MTGSRPQKIYCTPACRSAAYVAQARRVRALDNARKRCAWCDGPMPADARSFQRFCSTSCKDRDRWQRRREAQNAKRRAAYAADPEPAKARARAFYYRKRGF
jgi:hypothetical protein